MKRNLIVAVAAILCSAFLLPAAVTAAGVASKPEDAVRAYLAAMQSHDFPAAYDYVSSTLKGGKNREEWAKEQQYIIEYGEVKIFGFKVFPAVVAGDKAKVPNVLKSQDKFLNQLGLDEHEIYEMIKEEGEWRIDHQTLVQDHERAEYFPE